MSGSVSGLLTALSARSAKSQSVGANDRIRVGLIGCGGRGRRVLSHFLRFPEVSASVLCDVDQVALDKANQEVLSGKADTFKDYRSVLDRKDIDAVIIATPDHWHAIPTMYACQAGKDVYVEKPMSHSIVEGRRMVEAARKYSRVVQVGIQQQSGERYIEAAELVRAGKIGQVTHVNIWNQSNRLPGVGFPPDEKAPATLDWDFWLGPAPFVPYNPIRASKSFRGFWDYAGGTVTDWGTHHFGSLHHVMGQSSPRSVVAVGGKLAIEDIFETPDTLNVIWEYPGGWTVDYSLRETNSHNCEGTSFGLMFYGTEATLYLDRKGFEITPEKEHTPAKVVGLSPPTRPKPDEQSPPHIRDFLKSMRSRLRPCADVEVGHRATTAVHLANISLRTGRKLLWDSEHETIIGDPAASALLKRDFRKPYLLPQV